MRNLCKMGIPRVAFFCIKSMPSDTILPVVDVDPHSLATDAFQESWKGCELLDAFPLFNDRKMIERSKQMRWMQF